MRCSALCCTCPIFKHVESYKLLWRYCGTALGQKHLSRQDSTWCSEDLGPTAVYFEVLWRSLPLFVATYAQALAYHTWMEHGL